MSSSYSSARAAREYCDRLPRRDLIQAGLGGVFGLSLPTLLGLQTRSLQAQSLQTQSGNGLATPITNSRSDSSATWGGPIVEELPEPEAAPAAPLLQLSAANMRPMELEFTPPPPIRAPSLRGKSTLKRMKRSPREFP